ncbi:hypothetical protein ACSFBX_33105 [Variovorax sp. RB2P76]|uniref:hypothetical protein n=1 Tax=Variovorax sp. RB2P76 TaxID=3443736 RepID=UPI003F4848FB
MDGRLVSVFDLSEFELPDLLTDALLRAHNAEYGYLALETMRQAFRCIRKFLAFRREKRIFALPFPRDVAQGFHQWLVSQNLQNSTRQSAQAIVLVILKWCFRNVPGIIAKNANFVVPSFHRQPPQPNRTFDKKQTEAALSACYEEIAEFSKRLIVPLGADDDGVDLDELILQLLVIGRGKIPSQRIVNRSGGGFARRVQEAGGLRKIRSLIFINPREMFPFYLAILIQTAANPAPLRGLKLGAIRPHPLRLDLEFIDWDKPRSNVEQRVDFPTQKEWAAPNIIRKLLAINEAFRWQASKSHRDMVFLAHNASGVTAVPCMQLFHLLLNEFIAQHKLPNFDFKDWRSTVARAHRIATGSVESARKRLNHESSTTTVIYTPPQDAAPQYDRSIASFQGSLARLGDTPPDRAEGPAASHTSATGQKEAQTVFGFKCKDPFAGFDGITPVGKRCGRFTKCATCKGALVPLDDVEVIALILGTRDALEETKKRAMSEGRWKRYKELYEDTRIILAKDIIPAVSEPVLRLAQKVIRIHHIPYLE